MRETKPNELTNTHRGCEKLKLKLRFLKQREKGFGKDTQYGLKEYHP